MKLRHEHDTKQNTKIKPRVRGNGHEREEHRIAVDVLAVRTIFDTSKQDRCMIVGKERQKKADPNPKKSTKLSRFHMQVFLVVQVETKAGISTSGFPTGIRKRRCTECLPVYSVLRALVLVPPGLPPAVALARRTTVGACTRARPLHRRRRCEGATRQAVLCQHSSLVFELCCRRVFVFGPPSGIQSARLTSSSRRHTKMFEDEEVSSDRDPGNFLQALRIGAFLTPRRHPLLHRLVVHNIAAVVSVECMEEQFHGLRPVNLIVRKGFRKRSACARVMSKWRTSSAGDEAPRWAARSEPSAGTATHPFAGLDLPLEELIVGLLRPLTPPPAPIPLSAAPAAPPPPRARSIYARSSAARAAPKDVALAPGPQRPLPWDTACRPYTVLLVVLSTACCFFAFDSCAAAAFASTMACSVFSCVTYETNRRETTKRGFNAGQGKQGWEDYSKPFGRSACSTKCYFTVYSYREHRSSMTTGTATHVSDDPVLLYMFAAEINVRRSLSYHFKT